MIQTYKIILSDIYAALLSLENNSIDVAITSPPYWGQRDYGFDGQIGVEENYESYIEKLNFYFQILQKKLKPEGLFFLNIGDKYISKYGKTSLGFIPFQLAQQMQQHDWIIVDILIWYKPNHMPSSVKNRFINSYEPVFVFAKSKENLYQKYKTDAQYTNVLKIPLQPTPFKHVAAYPEKLVLEILKKIKTSHPLNVLDPFAGSGTTCKVVKEHFHSYSCILIEANESYIDIIKQRCNLAKTNTIFLRLDYIAPPVVYKNTTELQKTLFEVKEPSSQYNAFQKKNGLVKICSTKKEYYSFLEKFIKSSLKMDYKKNAIYFIGSQEYDNELICRTAFLHKNGWVLRNMLIIQENNVWFPVFMIVEDNKTTDYIFQYEKLKLRSKNENTRNWNNTDFTGYKVVDNLKKEPRNGIIVDVTEKLENGFPKYVIVYWENNIFTKEYVIYSQKVVNENITIQQISDGLDIQEQFSLTPLNKEVKWNYASNSILKKCLTKQKEYNGKFKNEKRINMGASPGARASMEEEHFSLHRLYEINQSTISDYINQKRKEKKFSKTQFTNIFPAPYKHTVGHWLRKDFGGSLPNIDDWKILETFLQIDPCVTNYVSKTALKIQTVKNNEHKIPDDFQKKEFLDILHNIYS